MTDALGLAEKVNKFNQQAMKHLETQNLNPFSDRFSRSPSPRPKFSKDEYGKPVAGSLTDQRGQKALCHISREILELCEVIHDMGRRRRDKDGDAYIVITFGELFSIYTKINDKVVGLLIAAKKKGFVYFEPEILFQRRDDDVLIALLKPVSEIRNIINRQLSASRSPTPAPPSTAPSSDKGEQTLS
uniref:Costars domain-containing protein n=1 Tax=Cuerna arida TaxID=1464854 RepID=A0A1B6GIJ3_9HEMI